MADDGQYLARLRDYYAHHRILPSYARIGTLVGLTSKGSVAGMVLRLKSEGFLESSPDRRLKPGRRFFERPIGESVQAGLPSAAPETESDSLAIDEHLIANPSKSVLLKVKGDSMIDAGIHEGDVVVVEKQTTANVGDIVVVNLENNFTLKRFARENGRVVLRPENSAHPIIRPGGDSEIFGVVVAMFRKYV